MPNNKDVNLEDMMNRKPRTGPITIDVTKGKVNKAPSNFEEEETHNSAPVTTEAETVKEVRAVQSGPIDMSSAHPINVNDILPKKEKPMAEGDMDLFAALDKAVAREKASITERIDAIIDAQDAEREEMAEKRMEEELDRELGRTSRKTISSDMDEDDLDLYDEDDDTSDVVDGPKVKAKTYRFPKNETHSDPNTSTESVAHTETKREITMDNISAPTESEVEEQTDNVTEEKKEDAPVMERVTSPSLNRNVTSILGEFNDDEGLFDDDTGEPTEEDREEAARNDKLLEELRSEVRSRVTPIKKKFDLSKFTINKKAISLQKVMRQAVTAHQNTADWILYDEGRPISMIGLSGPEILKLNPENSNRNRLNTFREMYRIIYNHVDDANKPDFEAWLKQTRFIDLQHIYFALYMATFGNSNFISYACPKCQKVFIQDVKLEDMVKYANDEVKDRVREILRMDSTSNSDHTYPVDLIQISDNYAFGIRTPSIWNVIIETASLTDRFLERYSDLIDIVAYIDSIYVIDEVNQQLIPVDTKPDPDDMAKTAARRVKAFYDILATLSTDEFYNLRAQIESYDKHASDINYILPGTKCPDCGEEIPANEDVTADSLLFTRHQLAAIGNMSNS